MLDKRKNYKMDVSALNTAERTRLQEELFKMGYRWLGSGQKITEVYKDFLFLYADMTIACSNSRSYFNTSEHILIAPFNIMPQTEERTLRDWFAGDAFGHLVKLSVNQEVDDYTPEEVARDAYRYADAMLKERNK